MKDNGKMDMHLEKESFSILMETFTMDSGLTIEQMGEELTLTLKVQSTMEHGKTTNSMAKVLRFGKRVLSMRVTTTWVGNRVKESTSGWMAQCMKETGLTTESVGMECTCGKMGGSSMDSG
jgi:hypothetical protein